MNPKLSNLLAFQEQDVKRLDAELQLSRIPQELKILEDKLLKEREAFDAEKKGYQRLEIERKDLDNQLRTAEDRLVQCKTKQSMVKKEEEYNALTVEIDTLTTQSGDLETEELELLMRLDEEKQLLLGKESAFKKREADIKAQIEFIHQKKSQLENLIKELEVQCNALQENVDSTFLDAYDDAKRRSKRAPFVVQLDGAKCTGCHLKISNEIIQAAKNSEQPHNCDNCGRLVYSS